MDRVNAIINSKEFKKYLKKIKACEKNRKFCKHNMTHFMNVARIAYIFALEEGIKIDKEIIYTIALLHDIGRFVQYEDKIPHERASVDLADDILIKCGYDLIETSIILSCIFNHRNKNNPKGSLEEIIYRADKCSRPCYKCKYKKECDWDSKKKNLKINV